MISSFLGEGQNIFLLAETELKSKQKETITCSLSVEIYSSQKMLL